MYIQVWLEQGKGALRAHLFRLACPQTGTEDFSSKQVNMMFL